MKVRASGAVGFLDGAWRGANPDKAIRVTMENYLWTAQSSRTINETSIYANSSAIILKTLRLETLSVLAVALKDTSPFTRSRVYQPTTWLCVRSPWAQYL